MSGVLMVWSATAMPFVEPETETFFAVPVKVRVPRVLSTVAVVGVPRPVSTALPVPVEATVPVATVLEVPADREMPTLSYSFVLLSSITADITLIFVGVRPVPTAEPVPEAEVEPVATVVLEALAVATVVLVKVMELAVSTRVSPETAALMPAKELAEALLTTAVPATPLMVVVTSF